MSVFDTMAENRYQQWLEDRQQPDYEAPVPRSSHASRQSYEGLLLQEVIAQIDKTRDEPAGPMRAASLQRADALTLQLMVALENRGLPLVAQSLQETLRQRRESLGACSGLCAEDALEPAGASPVSLHQRTGTAERKRWRLQQFRRLRQWRRQPR